MRGELLSLLLLDEPLALNLESVSFPHLHLLSLVLEFFDRLVECRSVFPQPRVTSDIFDRATLSWVGNEHQVEEVSRFVRDPFGEDQRRVEDVFVEEVDVVSLGIRRIVIVRKVPSEHRVEDDTARPDVNGGTNVTTILNDEFWCGVTRRTTRSRHEVCRRVVEPVRETEIRNDDVTVAVEEEVLEFEISVDDSLAVEVRDSRDELSKESRRIAFLEVSVCEDVVEQLSTYGAMSFSSARERKSTTKEDRD